MSCILSAFRVTSPEETVKSVPSKVATPAFVSVASSPEIVIVFPEPDVSIPSPPAIVKVSLSKSIDNAQPIVTGKQMLVLLL